MMMRWAYFLSLLLMGATFAPGADAPATRPTPVVLSDIAGIEQRPLELGSAKAAVILFIAVDCPISNGYAPLINRICKEYETKGVKFYLVHADPDLTADAAKKHAADFGYTCPVLIDRKHELVRRVGASVTPEAVIVAPDGALAYRGRIDDLYADLGKRRYEATTHDLRDALDSVLAGKAVANPRQPAVGCAISN